jgi:V/A-type H+-transporting ATPase subunit I
MDDVIEAAHSLDLLHISEYTNEIDGFEPGTPIAGADSASKKLVTVRSLKSILGVDEDYEGPTHVVEEDELDKELEDVRQEVNELDDRRDEIAAEIRDVEEDIEQLETFVDLGIDLDLLGGYDSLEVAVGEGVAEEVEAALADSEIEQYAVESGAESVAVFARVDDRSLFEDALVGATFAAVEVPDAEGDPAEYLSDRRHRREQLQLKLENVEDDLEELTLEVGGFLLAVEEQLTIDVEKREAPLSFATTKNAFVAEGWVPTEDVEALRTTLDEAADSSVEVDELERATYDEDGHVEHTEDVSDDSGPGDDGDSGPPGSGDIDRTDGPIARDLAEEEDEQKAAADGGYVPLAEDSPPVVQDNPGGVKPFEALVDVINRPKYTELDPTVILFLTFPAFFGFMIGDLGYGLLYVGMGYWIVKKSDSDVVKSLGGIAMWAGGFTAIFGVLYGEFFGLHQLGGIVWNGDPPIHKGLQPHYLYYAQAWLLLSVIVGVLHLVVGRIFDFYNNLHHGFGEAFVESGSWIMMTVGLWVWIFSTHTPGPKPDFMFTVFDSGEKTALALGFSGFPETVGLVGLGFFFVGLALAIYAEGGIALIESVTQTFGHVVSYTRIAAVLLAKAGMALAVNLLVFGAYRDGGEFHLIFFSDEIHGDVLFQGLLNLDGPVGLVFGLVFGIIVLLLGHLLVLVLGITSAGLQAVRLEYVEFFGKFYEGGGTIYSPFGHERTYTAEE